MDVHRARFVPYPASAISALAFSRSSDTGYTGPLPALKLALGRSNGDIELWNPLKGSWVQEAVCHGDGRSIDGLAWTQDPDETDGEGNVTAGQQRLFSIASSPTVTEWDLGTGMVKRRSTGNFSEVWCFAAQSRWRANKNSEEEPRSQDLVAGCGDGALVILSTADDDLQFKRNLARVSGKKARCMCIAYQRPEIVVAGFADSMIRVYDTRNGSQLRQMSLGVGLPGAPKNALVWQVKVLSNGDIVSGDSNGEVRIWDGRNYALSRRLTGHDSDCLDLITSADGKAIFSGSIDGKIAIYRQPADGGRSNWAKTSHRRVHNGEVKAMAAFDSKGMSVVISGGSDLTPAAIPLREYGKENIRYLPTLPQEAPVLSAPKARLLVSWWNGNVFIWRIARLPVSDESPEPERPRKLVAKVSVDAKDTIRGVSVSTDGKLLAVSTSTTIKAFQLKRQADSESLAIRKIELPKSLSTLGARMLSFSPDCKWLVAVSPDSEVHAARFTAEREQSKRLQCLSQTVELDRAHRKLQAGAFKVYERSISRLAWSSDSSVLVACDLAGYMDSWVLEGHQDSTAPAVDRAKHDSDKGSGGNGPDSDSDSSDDDDDNIVFYGQHWADNPSGHLLPKLESAPLVMTFRPEKNTQKLTNGNPGVHSTRHNPHAHSHELPAGEHMLWVLTSRHQMYEFDVRIGRLSEWSKRNPTAALPEEFTRIKDRAIGSLWDSHRERLWLYGSSWMFMLDVAKDLADAASAQLLKRRKRRPSEAGDAQARKRQKGTSGAGDRVNASMRDGGVDSVKRFDNGQWMDIDMTPKRKHVDEDDEDGDDESLQLTRVKSSGDEEEIAQGNGEHEKPRNWWLTFKYRPILGMVPLESDLEQGAPLEVAVVERPLRDR